jgi:acetyl-CoA acetyltransferase family protein
MAERFPLLSMGETAEVVAAEFRISRKDQDAFAVESHRKAARAWEAGRFDAEVVRVTIDTGKKGAAPTVVERDECIRSDSTTEALAKLRPVFKKDDGTVTAGNSSPLNDGAAALLLASSRWAKANGARPLARTVATAVAGVHPNMMGIGPVPATRKVLAKASLRTEDLDLIELNEAFAAQALACIRELGFDPAKVNVNGGAIALGHPIGCSGARIVVTLVHELARRGDRYGLATLCIGVGQGLAVLVERIPS